MPEAVELRQRRSRSQGRARSQGRTRVQGHIPSADYVLRALKRSRDQEERQILVNQSCESSDATPTLSVQSLRLAQQHDDLKSIPIGLRQRELEKDVDDRKVLIIVTDHSSCAVGQQTDVSVESFSRPRTSSSCCPTSAPQLSVLGRRGSRRVSQSVEVLGSESRTRSYDRRTSGSSRKSGKGERVKCRVSFDALDEVGKASSRASYDEVKRKKPKRKFGNKRFVKKTGKKLWRGVRASCKFLWSGLALGAMDLNFGKACDDSKKQERKLRECFTYTEQVACH